jgi:acyl-CoA hydrolase
VHRLSSWSRETKMGKMREKTAGVVVEVKMEQTTGMAVERKKKLERETEREKKREKKREKERERWARTNSPGQCESPLSAIACRR